MKIKILVKNATTGKEWWENYDQREINSLEEAQMWAENLVKNFNATLRPNEQPRELLNVELVGESTAPIKHQWRKTNSITIRARGGGLYDTYKCSKCGITGKRHGLTEHIVIDRKYKAKKYASCI